MPHKHAALMLQYAQDAAETDRPWLRWEVKEASTGSWISLLGDTAFYEKSEYRRKPRTININGFEVPEPMREWKEGDEVCIVDLQDDTNVLVTRKRQLWLPMIAKGICHITREAAELHAKALLSFTQKEETK